MQGKKPRVSNTEIQPSQTTVNTNANDAPKHSSSRDSDTFYDKLCELWDSLGLSLIINARETLLDLYLIYSEVISRGGYHKVSRDRKWDEVVSALKLEGSNAKLSAQLEKCYAHLLYPFEQLYHYRDPAKKAAANFTLGVLTDVSSEKKRKSEDSFSELFDNKDCKVGSNICKEMTGAELTEQQQVLLAPSKNKKVKKTPSKNKEVKEAPSKNKEVKKAPSKNKEVKKQRGASRRHRTAYQIFLKQEFTRMRPCNVLMGTNMLQRAIDAWRKMSEIEKQPYVEESKKEKERLMGEMNTQNIKEEVIDAGYHVTLLPDADNC